MFTVSLLTSHLATMLASPFIHHKDIGGSSSDRFAPMSPIQVEWYVRFNLFVQFFTFSQDSIPKGYFFTEGHVRYVPPGHDGTNCDALANGVKYPLD